MGVSRFKLEQEKDFFSSKARAREKREDWKDEGRVLIYETKINIAEEASRFGMNTPNLILNFTEPRKKNWRRLKKDMNETKPG